MEYLMLIIACVLIAFQFTANKIYQRKCQRRKSDVMLYAMLTGVFSFVIFLVYGIITGEITAFLPSVKTLSFWFALILATLSTLSLLTGVLAAKHGSTAIYSVFMMLGSMVIASVVGMTAWGEGTGALKIIGILVPCAAIVIPVIGKGEKMNVKFTVICAISGLMNGVFTIISASHSKLLGTDKVTSTNAMMLWLYLFTALLALVFYLIMRFALKTDEENAPVTTKSTEGTKNDSKIAVILGSVVVMTILSALMFSASSGFGYLLQLLVLEKLDATIVTPLVSGLTILMSAFAGLIFFKEKIDLKNVIAMLVTMLGVACIILDGVGVLGI